ncbi:hypothetical protein [Micromonospora sp. M61]|uniref:hypothetical protein n=1 Tax=Micromonospora sp. M61 TaxID=2824890 RepID=UPI001B395A23|nr:hypothetical protein [Micromonospora sp. M61]MBQ0978541.1 hypothetical protein [Micromonospora sp. M61]
MGLTWDNCLKIVIRPLLRLRLPALAIIAAVGLFVEWAYWFFVQDLIDPKQYWIQLSWFLRFPPVRFVEFLLGMIAAAALLRDWRPKLNLWLALSTVPASVLLLWWGAQQGWWGAHWSQQGLVPACVVVVLAAAIRDISGRPSIFRRNLSSPSAPGPTPSTWSTCRSSTG